MKSQRAFVLGCVAVAVVFLGIGLATRDSGFAPGISGQAQKLAKAMPEDPPGLDGGRGSLPVKGSDLGSKESLPIAEGESAFTDTARIGTENADGEEDADGEAGSFPDPEEAPSNWGAVLNDDALPCTGPRAPLNFGTFSVGPSINGLPLTSTERRCGGGPVATRVNYLSYIYGDCTIPPGETGCRPPLEIQTWPACQRFLAKYSFRGRPLPHRFLSNGAGAEVVEFSFPAGNRIEAYTGGSTVVIFAPDRDLAVDAVAMLRPEEEESPPASGPEDLKTERTERLEPPEQGSMEGALSC